MYQSHKYRVAAISILVLWVVLPLVTLGHVVVEDHTYCADHQRLEETGDAQDSAGHAALVLDADEAATANSGSSPADGTGGHERCALGDDVARDAQCPGYLLPTLVPQLAFAALGPSNVGGVHLSISILRAAPKNSPPTLSA
ncbi:MAG: hypothetical protein GY811_25205 [Myxococcales bacterium]|nr:hypothetical protein [Myxococcales bacterium]